MAIVATGPEPLQKIIFPLNKYYYWSIKHFQNMPFRITTDNVNKAQHHFCGLVSCEGFGEGERKALLYICGPFLQGTNKPYSMPC
jgi:hypothetical protein